MELLLEIGRNLERHAAALERVAEELERSRPTAGSVVAAHWAEQGMDGRIRKMRREAVLARRALRRVEEAVGRRPQPALDERAA